MLVKTLSKNEEGFCDQFLRKDDAVLLSYSLKFRDLIKSLSKSEDKYLIVEEEGKIVGALPVFIKINNQCGNILNSLPFYGSHGGVLICPDLPSDKYAKAKTSLLEKFYQMEKDYDCVSSTIITSPFENDLGFYEKNCSYTHRDSRIGQITKLSSNDKGLDENLMALFHSKTRNMVRKACKNDIQIFQSCDIEDLKILHTIHNENLLALDGIPKPFAMFQHISSNFKQGEDYTAFFARYKNKIVAGLLLLYFNKTVEYYTPAVEEEFRSLQPLSLLIYDSMKDAVKKGFKYYNFGGTWKSQTGVYRFKNRWGAKDFEYHYFTKLNRGMEFFKNIGKEKLLKEYPFFYTVPFSNI